MDWSGPAAYPGYRTPTSRMVRSSSAAHSAYREAGQFQCLFNQDGVRCLEQPFHEGHKALVCSGGFFPLACRAQLHDLLHSSRSNVSDGGDDAHATQFHNV